MTDLPTDIWFRTGATLFSVADAIGMANVTHDAEDHWEWLVGTSDNLKLDVTRTHTKDPLETDTRIFLVDHQTFRVSDAIALCRKLFSIAESDICLGQWRNSAGNEFDKIVFSRLTPDRGRGGQ